MDIWLQIITVKSNLWAIQQRLKNGREKIEKERPDKLDYIEGSKKSELQINEAEELITNLESIIKQSGRDNHALIIKNLELQAEVKRLKDEIKYNGIEL
jgi:hypothetical protein